MGLIYKISCFLLFYLFFSVRFATRLQGSSFTFAYRNLTINNRKMDQQEIKDQDIACGGCGCSYTHASFQEGKEPAGWRRYLPAGVSFLLLLAGLAADHIFSFSFFTGPARVCYYLVAYLPVGIPVWKEVWEGMRHGDFFNEFSLMALATLGAFLIGEYPEGVAVMLFYSVGELFQEVAVRRAKGNIRALLDIRPNQANVFREGVYQVVSPESVSVGERIRVKAGEKVPLDGRMLSPVSSFNTAALTGESVPATIREGERVLAGMVNLDRVIEVEVEKEYADSSLARILEMVQQATARKAKTELLITRFAKVYTPLVFLLAVAITVLPGFFVEDYQFKVWFYRALVFLVISCPCALVISVPLSYFGGIGAASRNGILFKGAAFLDKMASVNTVVMDKTGTLTQGVFEVQEVVPAGPDGVDFLEKVVALEGYSNHPVAKAIAAYGREKGLLLPEVEEVREIAGYGITGRVEGIRVVAGNGRLLLKEGISYDPQIDAMAETVVLVAVNGRYVGYVVIADELKEDAARAVKNLRKQGVEQIVMLSGDRSALVEKVAATLQLDNAWGDLLPEDKVRHIEELQSDPRRMIAFVGDGINDAPVLALSDVGIAMGGSGIGCGY